MPTGGEDTTSPRSIIITHNPSVDSVMGADGGRDNAAANSKKPSTAKTPAKSVTDDDDDDDDDVEVDQGVRGGEVGSNTVVSNEEQPQQRLQVTPEKKELSSTSDRTNSPSAPTQSSFTHLRNNSSSSSYHAQPHLTPQPMAGGSGGYYHSLSGYQPSQMTPEPPSPAGQAAVYDSMGSFFHQPAAAAAFGVLNSPFALTASAGPYPGVLPQPPPLSPTRTFSSGSMGGIPPVSPLFPRIQASLGSMSFEQQQRSQLDARTTAAAAASVPYLSAALGSAIYAGYGNNGTAGNQSNSSEDITGWGDRNQQNLYPHASPQINAQVLPVQYTVGMVRTASNSSRSYSFDETMLPPAVLDPQDPSNPTYSPYGSSQSGSAAGAGGGASGAAAAVAGATLFAHQQPWGYGQDLYNSPVSPLQPRPTAHIMNPYPPPNAASAAAAASGMSRGGGPYGQFYPATSPGPPIQTTASNKGPEGANLFIFHIPNHFTNLDMYHLFCPYGNLLSVRIMVEKDSGRSRGFGFVSYDSPESAALAIKELNGFVIGNKRLKVQHKQIKSNEQLQFRDPSSSTVSLDCSTNSNNLGSFGSEGAFARVPTSLPPPSPTSSSPSGWYDARKGAPQATPDNLNNEASDLPITTATSISVDHNIHHHLRHPSSQQQPNSAGAAVAPENMLDSSNENPVGGLTGLSSLEPLRNALPSNADDE